MAFTTPPNQEINSDLTESTVLSAEILSLEEGKQPIEENRVLSPLVAYVQDRYQRAKDKRQPDETRWLRAYRNHRGEYGPDVVFSKEEQSKVFVKVTKTKVQAAVAQIGDVLFAGGKFPIGVEATPAPTGVDEKVHIEYNAPQQPTSNITRPEIKGVLARILEGQEDKVKPGAGGTPTSVTFEPAKMAAKKMEKKIHDQLEESDAAKHLRHMAFEMALFGTGIIKGPFAITKEYPAWEKSEEGLGVYKPTFETVPKVDSVSVWNFYPDPDAQSMSQCEGVVERHKMSAYDLRQLKKRPNFRSESIDEAIAQGYNYQPHDWEWVLEDNSSANTIERYEVLEYWGVIGKKEAEDAFGDELPSDVENLDQFQINAWICNDQILRLVINPYTPHIIPYYAVPFEVNPYSFFGIGVAENMADTQDIMNGVFRMTIDNLALSGNIMVEVSEDQLVPGQSMEMFPGKVWRRNGGQVGQSVFGMKFPNVTQELMVVYDKARQLTDESTNLPSYAHGGTGVQGMGRTASGMSMLMGAAAQSIKDVVRNIDDYFLSPLGKNLFAFNMQFSFDEDIKGDLSVIAKGTESLMRNEIRSQRLLQFLQTGMGNPVTAPLVNADYILRELATSLDLDEEMVVNDPRKMMMQAKMIKEMQAVMGGGAQGAGGGAPSVDDPTGTGGGNIAPGNAPSPGAQGFTGSGGGANGGNSTSAKAESASI